MLPYPEQIHTLRRTFTPAQERIADYLLDHSLDAALLTATQLAQRLDVDPATVVRFAQKLGYRGYLELKAELGRRVQGQSSAATPHLDSSLGRALENAHSALSTQFDQLWNLLDPHDLIQWTEALATPCRLLILADETCANQAGWLADELRSLGFNINVPGIDPTQLAARLLALDPYDRVLFLEGPMASPTLEHLSQALQGKQGGSLALLASASSPIFDHVDAALQLPARTDPASFPSILQQLLAIVLHALRHLPSSQPVPGGEDEGRDDGTFVGVDQP